MMMMIPRHGFLAPGLEQKVSSYIFTLLHFIYNCTVSLLGVGTKTVTFYKLKCLTNQFLNAWLHIFHSECT